jgi:hypothetical protein
MTYEFCWGILSTIICGILVILFIKYELREREANAIRVRQACDALERAEANRITLIRNRIHYLEPMARNGDLIAFQEWKHLTGNHDVVDIGQMPDITFTGVMVGL